VRNQAKWECRKTQNNFEKKLAKESKKNPKSFYKYAQSKLKIRTGIAYLVQENGSLTTTDKQKADVLSNFFSSVFTREDTNNMPDTFTSRTDSELMDIKITPGLDGAAPRVLKELQDIIAETLYVIFRQSLDLGKIPVGWKMGQVSPIFKKGNRHQANNYRPVNLTSVICKTLESIMRDRIMHHIVENANMVSSKVALVSLNCWQSWTNGQKHWTWEIIWMLCILILQKHLTLFRISNSWWKSKDMAYQVKYGNFKEISK